MAVLVTSSLGTLPSFVDFWAQTLLEKLSQYLWVSINLVLS